MNFHVIYPQAQRQRRKARDDGNEQRWSGSRYFESDDTTWFRPPGPVTEEVKDADWWDLGLCANGTFARGFGVYQHASSLDDKGVTGVRIRCARDGQPAAQRTAIHTSGRRRGEEVHVKDCQVGPHRFLVGLGVIFGPPSLGVTEIRGICDIPNYPEEKRQYIDPKVS